MEERVLILKMLSEGKISAEEAEKLLAAMGSEKINNQSKNEIGQKFESVSSDITDAASKFADKMIHFVGGIYEKVSDRYKYTNTFNLSPENLKKLFFSANNCGMIVAKSSNSEITLKLDISSFMEINSFDGILETNQEGDNFFIKAKFPSNCWGIAEISVPENLEEVEFRGINGKIEINSFNAAVLKTVTSNAKIEIIDVAAKQIEALTDNAKINFKNVKADYSVLRSSNGKIEMDCCDIVNVNGRTSNGAIKLPCIVVNNDNNYDLQLETSNGAVSIAFEKVIPHGFSIDASTSNGKINVDLNSIKYNSAKISLGSSSPVLLKSDNDESSTAKINIKAKTINGPISIEEK